MKYFTEVFNEAVDKLENDAKEAGLNITAVCRETNTARATPDRWRKYPPKTIKLLDDMQRVVEAARVKKEKEPSVQMDTL